MKKNLTRHDPDPIISERVRIALAKQKVSQRPPACLDTKADRAITYIIPWVETSGYEHTPYAHNNGSHAAVSSLIAGIASRKKEHALQWLEQAAEQLAGAIAHLKKPHAKVVPGPALDGVCPMGDEGDVAYFASVRRLFPEIGAKFGPKAVNSPETELAFAACRSIRFATENAVRHGGEYSLNDLLAADKLARDAISPKTAMKGGAR